MKKILLLIVMLMMLPVIVHAAIMQNGIDPDAIIERILAQEKSQMEGINYVTYDAEYVEGENNDEGEFNEKVRFIKKIYIKYMPDTALMHEEYLEYYKDGELQDENKLRDEAKNRLEKKIKRKAKDISYSMMEPFKEENRENYNISYIGTSSDDVENYTCHHFKVTAREQRDDLINGDYYFDVETFNPVKIDFTPAKLTKKMMFKLKEMNLSIVYAPSDPDGRWLPARFDISGKGKAMFFIGVKFSGTEYYRNPVINDPDAEKYFEVNNGS